MKKQIVKASQPSERILILSALSFVQSVIIEEQRAGRAIEDEYQSELGAALDDDIPPLPFPEVEEKKKGGGKVSELAAQRKAAQNEKSELPGQIHIDEAIAEFEKQHSVTLSADKSTRRLAKVLKKKKVRRCRERVAALIKVKRYLEKLLEVE